MLGSGNNFLSTISNSWSNHFENILCMFVFSFILFIVVALFRIKAGESLFKYYDDKTVICSNCFKVKKADSTKFCDCRGEFILLERMEWIKDSNTANFNFRKHENEQIDKLKKPILLRLKERYLKNSLVNAKIYSDKLCPRCQSSDIVQRFGLIWTDRVYLFFSEDGIEKKSYNECRLCRKKWRHS